MRRKQRWLMLLSGGGLMVLASWGALAVRSLATAGAVTVTAVVAGLVACGVGLWVAHGWARRAEDLRADLSTLQLIDDALEHDRAPLVLTHPYRTPRDRRDATVLALSRPRGGREDGRVLSTVAAFLALGAIVAAVGALLGVAPQRQRWTFTERDVTVGELGLHTPSAHAGEWRLEDHEHATGGRALANEAGAADGSPALAIGHEVHARDLRASTRCRVSPPHRESACGLVFRFQDPDNHFVARLDASAGAVALAVVRRGQERVVQQVPAEIRRETWHELGVEARADRLVVSWNGRAVIETNDAGLPRAGAVGLWVPSSGAALFDELAVEVLAATPHPVDLFPFLIKDRG